MKTKEVLDIVWNNPFAALKNQPWFLKCYICSEVNIRLNYRGIWNALKYIKIVVLLLP